MQHACVPLIVSQFADHCAFLFEHRERAARSVARRATFDDLLALDDRIEAHLDGLRVSYDEGWRTALEALGRPGPGEVFAVSALAFHTAASSDRARARLDQLLETVHDSPVFIRPMSFALEWTGISSFAAALDRISRRATPLARAVALTASATIGRASEADIVEALDSDDRGLVTAGCWAALRAGASSVVPLIETHLAASDGETRTVAAYCAHLLHSARATAALETLATTDQTSPLAEVAATTLLRSTAPDSAASVHRALFGWQPASRTSLKAAGASGAREMIPFVLDHVESSPLARVAAEAFHAITGISRPDPYPSLDQPDDTGPSESPGDDRVDLDPDESTRWPAAAELFTWWREHEGRFRASTQYLEGVAVSDASLKRMLGRGRQATRAASAELFTRRAGRWFDVCAPAARQATEFDMEHTWA